MILLETYTTNKAEDFEVPPFLEVQLEVTGDLDYSMYNLSKKLDPEPSLVSNPHGDPPKMETSIKERTQADVATTVEEGISSAYVDDSAEDHQVKEATTSEPVPKRVDGLMNGRKNGFHCNIARDQLTAVALSKLDICNGSTVISDPLSEDGHIFLGDFADYKRFEKLCHSGKSGAAVK